MIYSDKKSSFDKLLNEDDTVSTHHQDIQKLGIEIFKVAQSGSPEIVIEICVSRMRDLKIALMK